MEPRIQRNSCCMKGSVSRDFRPWITDIQGFNKQKNSRRRPEPPPLLIDQLFEESVLFHYK